MLSVRPGLKVGAEEQLRGGSSLKLEQQRHVWTFPLIYWTFKCWYKEGLWNPASDESTSPWRNWQRQREDGWFLSVIPLSSETKPDEMSDESSKWIHYRDCIALSLHLTWTPHAHKAGINSPFLARAINPPGSGSHFQIPSLKPKSIRGR